MSFDESKMLFIDIVLVFKQSSFIMYQLVYDNNPLYSEIFTGPAGAKVSGSEGRNNIQNDELITTIVAVNSIPWTFDT